MILKRIVLLAAVLAALANTSALAQESGPLAMRLEFEWTIVGAVAGVAVGALVWLTDPANPGNNLADSVASGAAWGAVLGAGFGVTVLQRAAVFPPGTVRTDPLDPRNRISDDPVAQQSGEGAMLAQRFSNPAPELSIRVPVLRLQF